MSSNISSGFCNSICSHPSCWNYQRGILKNKINTSNTVDKKPLSVMIPHQSIQNIDLDVLPIYSNNFKNCLNSQDKLNSNNDILSYLLSRKKAPTPRVPHVTPYIASASFLKDSTNTSNSPVKLSRLDVHEICNMEELKDAWKNTFKTKNVYVWIPGQQNNRDSKSKKEPTKMSRIAKTPILQLAPVWENQMNSSRKHTSSMSCLSEITKKNPSVSPTKSIKKIPKRKTETLQLNSSKGIENVKENIEQKIVKDPLYSQKMRIHDIIDRNFSRLDSTLNNQIYVLEPMKPSYSFEKIVYQRKKSSMSNMSSSSSGPRNLNLIRNHIPNFRTVSIIDTNYASYPNNFSLGPRRLANSINTDSSRTQSSLNPESNNKTSHCDSMATNALSDRSTLNDEDLLPGSSLIKILQHSYKLVNERSENIYDESQARLMSKSCYDDTGHRGNRNIEKARSAKSASENIFSTVGMPKPPPPSPETLKLFRSTSASADLNRTYLDQHRKIDSPKLLYQDKTDGKSI